MKSEILISKFETNPNYQNKNVQNLGWLALRPCHAVAYDMQSEMSSSPTGVLRLPAGP
jgi:hypothetical protein